MDEVATPSFSANEAQTPKACSSKKVCTRFMGIHRNNRVTTRKFINFFLFSF